MSLAQLLEKALKSNKPEDRAALQKEMKRYDDSFYPGGISEDDIHRNIGQWNDVVRKVMTALYKDPANVFVMPTAMLYIAKAQLSGEDTAPMLRYSRQNDCSGDLVSK